MTTLFYEVLGENIRKKRDACGLTQEALANKVGISRPSLANIERGRQRLTVDQLVEIAGILEVSLEELVPAKDAMQSQPSAHILTSDLPTVDRWLQVAKRGN